MEYNDIVQFCNAVSYASHNQYDICTVSEYDASAPSSDLVHLFRPLLPSTSMTSLHWLLENIADVQLVMKLTSFHVWIICGISNMACLRFSNL